MTRALARRIGLCRADIRGTSAVEFGLLAPIFCLILAATVDFGGVLYVKFALDGAVSAAANYALNNAASATSTSGAGLASNVATIVSNSYASNWANSTVVVDNGPTATITAGAAASSGTAANADSCYCPTGSASSLTWGSAMTCGAACANGSVAGKYVAITSSHTYTAIFASYGIITNGAITASSIVQVK